MVSKCILSGVLVLACISSVAYADRTLNKAETLQIFEKLTSRPKTTWINSGTIEARHQEFKASKTKNEADIQKEIDWAVQEYKNTQAKRELTADLQSDMLAAIPFNVRYQLANEYTMTSSVIVKYDGKRFYWEINVDSRKDSVTVPDDLAGNYMTDQFNLELNAKRIFSYDGEKYTMYFQPGNQAIVDTTGSTPAVVNGPLTAGVIPWGNGLFTYKNLSAAKSVAIEESIDDQTLISLTLQNPDGSEMLFTLDAKKDYAVKSFIFTNKNSKIVNQYNNFQLVSGAWVPATIAIEKYDASGVNLLESDVWYITKVSTDIPSTWAYDVQYASGATIQFNSNVTKNPVLYTYSPAADTQQILAEKLDFTASQGKTAQNCATAAFTHVAAKLGKNITDRQLSQLIKGQDKATSLCDMMKLAKSVGLNCLAVKADIQTLRNLSGYEVILHNPQKNHFTVMEGMDNEFIWSVDLTNDKFFYPTELNSFASSWNEGVVLVIANRPIILLDKIQEIADSQLRYITGAAGYSCTNLLQAYDVIFCNYIGGLCNGLYTEFYERYGCQTAVSGSCLNSILLRKISSLCIDDLYLLFSCTITGEWTFYYMRACA
jgi:hypothetical protein